MNYFQLLGLEHTFTIDQHKLSTNYQQLQKAAHPDRFANASSQEQLLAVQKSSTINDAYQTLKNPLKRAEYMLTLRGTEMPSEQSTVGDMQFLMRQMELREMLEDIKQADDIDDAIFELSQVLDTEFETLNQSMQQLLSKNDKESDLLACENLRKLKFYQKLHDELERLEEQLLDN